MPGKVRGCVFGKTDFQEHTAAVNDKLPDIQQMQPEKPMPDKQPEKRNIIKTVFENKVIYSNRYTHPNGKFCKIG